MNRQPQPTDDHWESDAVWKLLDQAPPASASARFVDNTVRAAKLLPPEKSWWGRLFTPAPLGGLAAATAGVALALMLAPGTPRVTSTPPIAQLDSAQAVAIQDIAETETLIAASDRLDDFSDNELVSLIGF